MQSPCLKTLPKRPALVVGLTGGIASGKTTVSDLFAAKGVSVIDTDRIARAVVAPGTEGLAAIIAAFGKTLLNADGSLNRAALRNYVFADATARAQLEAITHPLIYDQVALQLAQTRSAYAIVVVPLLIETNWHKDMDRVLVIDVPQALQRERLIARDGVDDQTAEQILASQTDRAHRLTLADDCIDNQQDHVALTQQVEKLHQHYQDLAARC